VMALGDQPFDKVRAYEARAACDYDLHRLFLPHR
jgi:hypothetical protein